MKTTLMTVSNWFASHPRETAALLVTLVMLLTLAAVVLPGDVALAGEITSGS